MASAPRSETPSAVPPLTPARPVIWPPRVHKTLSNGLEVVLVESHTIPKFTGELFFRSGNAVASAKAPGLADMTATVARTGTQKRTSREIEEDLRRMGSDLSSGAGADTSVISFAGLMDFSNDLLGLVSELAQQASFPADEFERDRRQLVEGLRIERTTPGFLASERLRRVLFGAHPYGTISPTEEQVTGYRIEQLK
jgi:zinc protease